MVPAHAYHGPARLPGDQPAAARHRTPALSAALAQRTAQGIDQAAFSLRFSADVCGRMLWAVDHRAQGRRAAGAYRDSDHWRSRAAIRREPAQQDADWRAHAL